MHTAHRLREFVTTNFYIPPDLSLEDDTSFLERGILDSTGVIELVVFIENQFGIAVADEELTPSNFDSLGALTTFVESKRGHP